MMVNRIYVRVLRDVILSFRHSERCKYDMIYYELQASGSLHYGAAMGMLTTSTSARPDFQRFAQSTHAIEGTRRLRPAVAACDRPPSHLAMPLSGAKTPHALQALRPSMRARHRHARRQRPNRAQALVPLGGAPVAASLCHCPLVPHKAACTLLQP